MKTSRELFERAQKVIPGGVNSPVRAFGAVGGVPLFIHRAEGSRIWDVEGRSYIDYVGSWGPMILGHSQPRVVEALSRALRDGTSYGAPTEKEAELAELICDAVPSVERVRLVNSGTEATMSAIRVARGFTGRKKILKFDGCYHGHSDQLLVQAGSGVATLGLPGSAGIPDEAVAHTLSVPFNDLGSVEEAVARNRDQIACVIAEPIAGNMGVVPPAQGFLPGLRRIATREGIVLIFDEVITGFRVAYGGAQQWAGIEADLTCLGKIIGGGLPVGAYGGRKQIMDLVAPVGPVYQAGTLSGNPLAVTAGIETLRILKERNPYPELEQKSQKLAAGLQKIGDQAALPARINRVGSMMTLFFTGEKVQDYASAKNSRTDVYAKYFQQMLKQGIYLPPSQFEAFFLSTAHADQEIDQTLAAARLAFSSIL